jgi:antitoxin component YwqK of YwqJK toxin-antitoxin module
MAVALVAVNAVSAQDMEKRTYYPGGQVKEVVVEQDGRAHYTAYHENGQLSQRGAFWMGRPDGVWRQYNEQGNLVCRVKFTAGHRTGIWVVTNVNGRDKLELKYRADKLQRISAADENGDMVVVREEKQ